MPRKPTSKYLDKMIDEEIHKLLKNKKFKRMIAGTFAEDAISNIAEHIPVADKLYEPIKYVADLFSANQSKLLPSAKFTDEERREYFKDDDFLFNPDGTPKYPLYVQEAYKDLTDYTNEHGYGDSGYKQYYATVTKGFTDSDYDDLLYLARDHGH